jgi:hypothetical protein
MPRGNPGKKLSSRNEPYQTRQRSRNESKDNSLVLCDLNNNRYSHLEQFVNDPSSIPVHNSGEKTKRIIKRPILFETDRNKDGVTNLPEEIIMVIIKIALADVSLGLFYHFLI